MERILNKQRIRFEGMKNTFVHTDREKTERAELNSYFSCLDGSCSELCYEGYYFHENYQDYICYSRNHEFRYDKHLEYIDSKDWFCNSQLFYDGYSLEDGLSYEEYLEYIDSKDYYSYSNIN